MAKGIRRSVKTLAGIICVLALGACASQAHLTTRHLLEGNDAAVRADYSSAVTHYEAALKRSPDSGPARRNLGIVLVKVGQYERARKQLKEILPEYREDVEVLYFLGEASRGVDAFQEAANYYEQAKRLAPGDIRIVKALAWTWSKMRLYDKSLAASEGLLRKYPGDLQAKLIVSNNYNKLGLYAKTVEVLAPVEKTGFKVFGRDLSSAESERALLISTLAEAHFGLNNCDKATALYDEVLKTRPFLGTALVGSARCDLAKGDNPKAVSKLERAIRSSPNAPEPYYLLGQVYGATDSNRSTFYYRRFLLLTQNNRDYLKEIQATRTALGETERRSNSTINGK
jgi:tetratricopeptide (TPR) repeat protein